MPATWYPSCKVRLLLRFEDFAPSPAQAAPLIEGEPEAYGGQQFRELKFDIIPYNCTITLNSYREADQATVVLPFAALPLDPRVLRSVAVQIFAGTVDPQAYADGMGPIAGQSTVAVVPDSADPTEPSAANEIFRGFVDVVEVNQDGDDTVSLECRDLTSIFLDAEVYQQSIAGLPRDLPLDEVISQVLIGEPPARDLPQAPPLLWTVAKRQTVRGKRRSLRRRVLALGNKIARLKAKADGTLSLSEVEKITAKAVELSVRQQQLLNQLNRLTREEAEQESVPLLAQRFGLPGARGIRVVNDTRYDVMPALGELKGLKYFDSKGTAKKSPSAGSRRRVNYWDLLTDLCVASGFICYVRRPTAAAAGGVIPPAELVISEPRTYYGDQPGAPSPEIREFAYGYNIDSLVVERNLTGKNAPQVVQIQARTAESGELVTARFPAIADQSGKTAGPANRATPSKLADRVEVQTLNYKGEIPEARAEEILALVAEKVYEELSRGEFKITIKTADLSFLPSNRDAAPPVADVFQLRSGDSIRIGNISNATPEIEQGLASGAGIFSALALPDRVRVFSALGFTAEAAVEAATSYENDLFQDVFRVRSVGVKFDHNTGFEIEVQAVNYLDARNALANLE